MIENLVEIDKEIFLFLNSMNHQWMDPLMIALSSYILWGIVFACYGLLVFMNRKSHKVVSVLFYVVSVAISSLATNVVKLFIQRPRPIHEEVWEGVIHNIEKYSAAYSFFSSHAATAFCIAMFVTLSCKSKRIYGFIAFVWAFGVSYSRIYVGKHYPGDVLVGILFGFLCGYMGYRMLERYIERKDNLVL